MRFLGFLLLAGVVAVAVFGCGGGELVDTEPDVNELQQIIGPMLDELAETGDPETVNELRSYIEEDMAEADPAKSQAMMKDLEELQAMTNPADIKKKAAEMKSKL
jgi:hypothetical protein